MKLSLIIPVYNRPDEIMELLDSLTKQTENNFDIIIVEDGSEIKCDKIIEDYNDKLDIKYFFKPNSGPGQSRNYGAERSTADYVIFLDSDCLIPYKYVEEVNKELKDNYVDCFGGPDNAHSSFTNIQKAINYAMTSFITTGGIRGKKKGLDKFFPRSFNMGYSKEVFEKTGGFGKMRFGEDIDMSLRIIELGYKTRLFDKAFVYHKRRTNFRQFYKQVHNSGIARINLYKLHPQSLKLVHFLPSVFVIGMVFLILFSVFIHYSFSFLFLALVLTIFIDSLLKNKSVPVAYYSVIASLIQLTSYGLGFIKAYWKRVILKEKEFSAFNKNFYK